MASPLHTRGEVSGMRAAVLVSGVAHLAIVIAAIVAGQLFTSRDMAEFQVAEVSLVPASSFDADISERLSAAPETAPEPPQAPEVAEAPDPAAPSESPAPAPNLRPVTEAAPPEPAPAPEDVATLAAPPAPEAPTPPEPVAAAEPPRPETPEPPAQPVAAEAPEPDPQQPPEEERVAQPPPPRPRPQRVARAAEAEPEPQAAPPDPQPAAEQPSEQPPRPTATASAPERSGPPLTFAEKDGIRFAIQRCWSVPVGLEAAENLSVTLGVTLSRDGDITAGPTLMAPTGTLSRGHQVAFGAARRAILRCAPYKDFPPEKYAQWRELEVTFNPKEMVIQ